MKVVYAFLATTKNEVLNCQTIALELNFITKDSSVVLLPQNADIS
jgi:hypothetical protein